MADPIQTLGYSPYQNRPEEVPDSTFGDLVGASFRQGNTLTNLHEMATREAFERDPGFSAIEFGKNSDLWATNADELVTAQSEAEFRSMEARLKSRQEDLQVLMSRGWQGFAMMAAAGMLDPTMLIPFVGGARGVKGIAQSFALAGAASAAAEVPIAMNQLGETTEETMINIGAGTVLGGLLGSAAVMLSRDSRARIAADIPNDVSPSARASISIAEDGRRTVDGQLAPLRFPEDMGHGPARELESFTGKLSLGHGFNDETPPVFVRDFDGPGRYGDSVFGENNRVYLDAEGRWINGEIGGMHFDRMIDVEASFDKALVIAPDNIAAIAKRVGGGPLTGKALADWAEANGYDGLIIRDFDNFFTDMAGMNLQLEGGTDAGAAAWRKIQEWGKSRGVNPDDWQDQIISFAPEKLKTKGVREVIDKSGGEFRRQHIDLPGLPKRETANLEDLRAANVAAAPGGGARSAGAAATNSRFVPETIDPYDPAMAEVGLSGGAIQNAEGRFNPLRYIAKTNPIARLVQQDGLRGRVSHVLRAFAQQLDDTGLTFTGNRLGVATSEGGSVIARKQFYIARMSEAMRHTHEGYLRYLYGDAVPGLTSRTWGAMKTAVGKSPIPGKMSFLEFKEQLADALNVPGTPVDPVIKSIAAKVRTDFYEAFNKEMMDATDARGAKALYDIKEESDAWGYFTHVFAPEKIAGNPEGFVKDVADHYEAIALAYYTKKLSRYRRTVQEGADAERIAQLPREEAVEEITRLTEALKYIRQPEKMDAIWDEAELLRDEARDLEDMLNDKEIYDEDLVEEIMGRTEAGREATDPRQYIEDLRDEADRLEASIPDEAIVKTEQEVKDLQRQLKLLRSGFGHFEEEAGKIAERIAENQDRNLSALTRIRRGTQKLLKDMDKLDDAKLDKELGKLLDQLDRQEVLIEKGRQRLEKMAPGSTERFEIEAGRQLTRQLKEMRLNAKVQGAKAFDRNLARQRLEAKLEDTMRSVNKVNEMRSRRNQKMLTKLENYDPNIVLRTIGDQRVREMEMAAKLEEDVRLGGGEDFNVQSGELNFRKAAEETAEILMDKILGNYTRLGQMEVLPGLRGPMKHRVLNLPYNIKKKYLELDTDKVFARYTETMGSDIEMFRSFGDVSGKKALEAVRDDFKRIRARIQQEITDPDERTKALQDFDVQVRGYEDTFGALIMRARGMWGLQNAKGHMGVRLGRMMLNWNVASMMGTVAVSSVSDLSRAIAGYGVGHTFKSSFVPMIRSMVNSQDKARVEAQIRMLKGWGIGIDTWAQGRTRGTFDLLPPDPYASRFERGMEGAANSMPIVAGFGMWTDAMKMLTGMASFSRFSDVIERMATTGKIKPEEMEWLAATGINEPLAMRIWSSFNEEGGADNVAGMLIPNTGAWTDRQAARAFEAAMVRESNRLIVTPGLEKPLWTDASIAGRLISQFRGFMFSANTKVTVAAFQGRDRATHIANLNGYLASMGLGAISYYIWALTAQGDAWEEMQDASWGEWTDQMLQRGGYLGIMGEVQNVGSAIPLTQNFVTFGGKEIAGRRADDLMGAVLGPTFGKAQDISQLLLSIDQPTVGTTNQARKIVPYQNVFYLKWLFEQVEGGVNSMFNLPEKRS